MPNINTCGVCKTRIKKGQGRKMNGLHADFFSKQDYSINVNKNICAKCRISCHKKANVALTPNPQPTAVTILPFPSVGRSRARCVICGHKGQGMKTMPPEARLQVSLNQGIIVQLGMICCKHHLYKCNLKFGTSINPTKQETIINTTDLSSLLNHLRDFTNTRHKLDFNCPMSEEDLLTLTGLTLEHFKDLCASLISIRKSKNRTTEQAVGMLLMKLRLGLSDRVIGTLCGFRKRRTVSRIISSARTALTADFVPMNLGFDHISRASVRDYHTTDLAVQLFSNFLDDSVILTMDGTYIYIQKSSKHQFQKKCFSMHKYRPLIKQMMICTTTGYIVSVVGPYFANGKNNDASITEHMFKTNADNISSWLMEDDILILDRGFRDVLPFLGDIGLLTHTPVFLKKSQSQMSTTDANRSRLVTKLRWVVEGVNGRLKTWQYLNKIVANKDLPNIWHYIRIITALCNKYKSPLCKTSSPDQELAHRMLSSASLDNQIQQRISKDKCLQRRSKSWKGVPINSPNILPSFPEMSEIDLQSITFGVYQVKQARYYADEHIVNGLGDIYVHQHESDLVHARISSRHTSSKHYNLWIQHSKRDVGGWYCECKAGARTVGCCVHIATVIWYLAYARRIDYSPKRDNYSVLLKDASNLCSSDDSSDSD